MNAREIVGLALTVLVAMAALVALGCGPQPLPEELTPIPTLPPATMPAGGTKAEATVVRAVVPTPAGPSVEQGQVVFAGQCARCHNLTEEAKVGPGLAGLWEREALPNGNPFSEENLKEWIRTGGGAMPGFADLSESDLDSLVLFLDRETAP